MRVGYVLKRYPRYSETFIRNEIAALETAGWTVEIFSLRPTTPAETQPLMAPVQAQVTPVPHLKPSRKMLKQLVAESTSILPGLSSRFYKAEEDKPDDVFQAVWIAHLARAQGIEYFHAHFATLATTVTRLAAAVAGVPYGFTAHAKDIYHQQVHSEDLRRKIRDAAAVITVSDYNCRFLREQCGPGGNGIHRIYNGLDLKLFPFREPNDRPPQIAAVGRLVQKKGFLDLVAACAILQREGQPFECRIAGAGELQERLNQEIQKAGLQQRVKLLGARPQQEVIELIQGAAVLAAPCAVAADGDRDGLPTVLLEAMALGTPCVSTDVVGIPEVIKDEETGLIVPPNDPQSLARNLKRLLLDAQLRVRLANCARRLIAANHDIHKNSVQLRAIFERAVRLHGGDAVRNGSGREHIN